jgi:uncharacterized protein (TIGR03083 family)
MLPLDELYSGTKALLIASIGEGDWQTPVPATPGWSVRDVVAHVTGIAATSAQGRMPADINLLEQFRDDDVVKVRDSIADGQVEERAGRTPDELLKEWTDVEPSLQEALRGERPLPMGMEIVVVTDVCVHSDDIALALGQPPHLDNPALKVALAGYLFGIEYRIRELKLPALAVSYEGKTKVLGDGEPAGTITASRWELVRMLAGRRSAEQIRAMDWSGDPSPFVAILPAYGERADDLVEAFSE